MPRWACHGSVSLATTGYPAARANSRAWASDPGSVVHGDATPNSRHTWCSEYLPASRRGSPAGSSGKRNQRRSSLPCSARKMAPASSVGISTAGRPMIPARRARPARTRSASRRIGPPEEAAVQVPGARRRGELILVHRVHGDASPSQGPDYAQPAVMHDIRIEFQHHRWRAGIHRIQHGGHGRADRVRDGLVSPLVTHSRLPRWGRKTSIWTKECTRHQSPASRGQLWPLVSTENYTFLQHYVTADWMVPCEGNFLPYQQCSYARSVTGADRNIIEYT